MDKIKHKRVSTMLSINLEKLRMYAYDVLLVSLWVLLVMPRRLQIS